MPGTIAVLGSGLNLSWLQASWLTEKVVAYWGDLDTWGLTMLGRAKTYLPHLTPLLMNREVFLQFEQNSAVEEPQAAQASAPGGLSQRETELYDLLLQSERGRLEQEFLPPDVVHDVMLEWLRAHNTPDDI